MKIVKNAQGNFLKKYYYENVLANQLYKLIKQKSIQCEKLTKFDIILSRFDLVYERSHKLTDKISNKEFLNSSYIQFQYLHPYKNIASDRNRKGLLLNIGNRKGRRHYSHSLLAALKPPLKMPLYRRFLFIKSKISRF